MKKVTGLLCLLVLSVLSCSKYDDSEIWDYVKDMNQRLTALEEKCKDMNTNITSLQTIVAAFESGDYITNVAPVMRDGIQIGYTITFLKSAPITIYNGNNGTDGNDGYTPVIGVQKDADGLYYWTVDGEWLLTSEGEKVRASGIDGQDGSNGTNGTNGDNGITPLLKIEDEYWKVSYDGGTSWQILGKATGDKGTDGVSFFSSVNVGTTEVTFVLADGTTFSIPLQSSTAEHEYVDLGLPSGTLWATCNVGADIPWEYGDYFAWGETEPKLKRGYSWQTYKYCNGAENKLTKYGINGSYGKIDNIRVLEPMDDAATANWGNEWQMPSREQFNELIDNNYTIIEWKIMQYGVDGVKITSKSNGKSIFLSAAGYYDVYNNPSKNPYCYYWTCDLSSTDYYNSGTCGYVFGCSWDYGDVGYGVGNRERMTGMQIRPVRKK